MSVWADYSGGTPSGAELTAAGITGVVRYVGIGGGGSLPHKRLSRGEYQDLVANGIQVLAVVEALTTDADGGYEAGVANAQAAAADVAAITAGLPPITVLFAANDKPSWAPPDVDYVRGFRDVLGLERTGAYGFSTFLAAVHAGGLASVFWQAGNPPSATGTDGFVHLWQRNGYDGRPSEATVAGVTVDLNDQLLPLPASTLVKGSAMPEYLKEILADGSSGRYARIDGGVVTGTDEATAHATMATWHCGAEQGVDTKEMNDHVAKSDALTGVLPAVNSLIAAVNTLTDAIRALQGTGTGGSGISLDQMIAAIAAFQKRVVATTSVSAGTETTTFQVNPPTP